MLGCRAIYHDGWKAVVFHPMMGFGYDGTDPTIPFDEQQWELYHVAEDFSEIDDLAGAEPGKLKELVDLWWDEAARNQALPVTNQPGRHGDRRHRRERYSFRAGIGSLPEIMAPNLRNRAFRISAELDIPDSGGGGEGVVATHGSAGGGYSLFVKDGRLHYTYNFLGIELTTVTAEVELPSGPTVARVEFVPTGPFAGDVDLYYGDLPVGQGHVVRTMPITYGMAPFSVGYQRGPAVAPDYEPPFAFAPGVLGEVVFEVEGRPYRDPAAEQRAASAIQ
jgi:arylsulfatase